MPKFRFVGDPNDDWSGPKSIDAFGLTFTRDDFTPVPPDVAVKLAGNSHFEAEGGDAPAKRKGGWPKGQPRKPRVETPPEEPDDDGDNDNADHSDEAA
jgi:hypothetical protein